MTWPKRLVTISKLASDILISFPQIQLPKINDGTAVGKFAILLSNRVVMCVCVCSRVPLGFRFLTGIHSQNTILVT